jgi:hypothetical protein
MLGQIYLDRADYSCWNHVTFVTLNEFIYLIAGYEPLHNGPHGTAYLNLSDREFKKLYKKVKRIGDELPRKTSPETEVKDALKTEKKYEAVFLIKWARSKGIQINADYNPIESEERRAKRFLLDFIGRETLSRDEFVQILVVYNSDKDKEYFETRLYSAVDVMKLTPIGSDRLMSDDPAKFNYNFRTDSLIEYALQKKWELPSELMDEYFEEKRDKNQTQGCADDIHPNKLKSIYKMTLAMAVAKYGYKPNNRNSATGANYGSIKGDVQQLGGALGRHDLNFNIDESIVKTFLDDAAKALLS